MMSTKQKTSKIRSGLRVCPSALACPNYQPNHPGSARTDSKPKGLKCHQGPPESLSGSSGRNRRAAFVWRRQRLATCNKNKMINLFIRPTLKTHKHHNTRHKPGLTQNHPYPARYHYHNYAQQTCSATTLVTTGILFSASWAQHKEIMVNRKNKEARCLNLIIIKLDLD